MQSGDVRALDGNIGSARLEVTRHQDAIASMGTLLALPAEINRHDRGMGDVMDAMGGRMGGMMSHCSGSGMNAMHDRMGAITSEMHSYRVTMTAAATRADARNECTVHVRRVDGMLDEMEQVRLAPMRRWARWVPAEVVLVSDEGGFEPDAVPRGRDVEPTEDVEQRRLPLPDAPRSTANSPS